METINVAPHASHDQSTGFRNLKVAGSSDLGKRVCRETNDDTSVNWLQVMATVPSGQSPAVPFLNEDATMNMNYLLNVKNEFIRRKG